MRKINHLEKQCLSIAVIVLIAVFFCSSAMAAPTQYSFTTATFHWSELPDGIIEGDDRVSGTFTYDSDMPATGVVPATGPTPLIGATLYNSSFSDLSGTIKGLNFSDLNGSTVVMNDNYYDSFLDDTVDLFQLTVAGPEVYGLPLDFSGFTMGDYTLVSARLVWAEGPLMPDFLDNQNLLASLPVVGGNLYLDFIHNDLFQTGTWSFSDYLQVGFELDTLSVTTTPPPTSTSSTGVPIMNGWWLLAALGGGVALLRRRKH